MQFMVFMIPAVYQPKDGKQQAFNPDPKRMVAMMTAMGKFNDEVAKNTTVLSINGLAPLARGARLGFAGGKPALTDGPAIESREVVGGWWLVEAKSKQQVVDLWKRCPAEDGDVIEIRPIAEMSDFPVEVQRAVGGEAGSKEPGAGSKAPEPKKGTESNTKGPFKKARTARTKEQD